MNILDIAKEAGVSTATVSRVLNNGPVSAEKRTRVLEIIERNKFLPNENARGISRNQTETIGLITHGISNHFHTEFIEVIERRCSELGLLMFVCISQRENQLETERKHLQNLIARRVKGILLHDPTPENYDSGFLSYIAKQIPLVIVHSFHPCTDINTVNVDQSFGMELVMRHLTELGHRDIMFIRGGFGHSFDIKEEVWRRYLGSMGTPTENIVTIEEGNSELGILSTEEKVSALLDQGRIPTAIFGCNDIMASGALNAARKHALRVPEDISIVGHDNTILATSSHLSSVDLKTQSVGHAAIDLLAYAMNGSDTEPRRVIITPEFIDRGSAGHPRLSVGDGPRSGEAGPGPELRQGCRDRGVEIDLAGLDELHDSGCGEQLGDRARVGDRIGSEGRARGGVGRPKAAGPQLTRGVGDRAISLDVPVPDLGTDAVR
jgi:LacI family transcriptional regulator